MFFKEDAGVAILNKFFSSKLNGNAYKKIGKCLQKVSLRGLLYPFVGHQRVEE